VWNLIEDTLVNRRRSGMTKLLFMILSLWMGLAAGCEQAEESKVLDEVKQVVPVQQRVMEQGKQVLEALKTKDMEKLGALAHPEKGVRFTPFGYVDTKSDLIFSPEQIRGLTASQKTYLWGTEAGSGFPLELTFGAYYDRFIFDLDFTQAKEILYNSFTERGTTRNNVFEVYPKPEHAMIEYHFPGIDPKFEGADWRSLRLVFSEHQENWLLVGIIHDQFTP
jgi:hypothetical protein